MSEDRCIICGEIIPEGRHVCPICEKEKPMKNLSHGEMVQIAEGKKKQPPRYIDANKLIDLATHEGAYGYVDVHDIYNAPTADVVERQKGEWRVYEGEMTCSCCETTFYTDICEYIDGNVPKFCPWCGADMRGEKQDG